MDTEPDKHLSDTIADLRAQNHHRRAQRAEIWAKRQEIADELRRHGFRAEVMDHASRHMRVYFDRKGFFDFWPTTGRWMQNMQPGGKPGLRGYDLVPLIEAMKRAQSLENTRNF